ncbi:unnamed protein product [Auanema sp. JU1783]|nr:unnamed protein product [Auanema sp. JU1783]
MFVRISVLVLTVSLGCLAAPVIPGIEDLNLPSFTKEETHSEKFTRSDMNKDKKLNFDEFLHMELAYVEAKKEEFEGLDSNHDGMITQEEYEKHHHEVNSKSAALRAEYFSKVFEEFDEDFDMALNQEEVERVLAERFLVKPKENFPKIFYNFDSDHSGGLDLSEYMKFDANFPFDQTTAIKDEIKQEKLPGDKAVKNDAPLPESADEAAIKAVLAQSGARRAAAVA